MPVYDIRCAVCEEIERDVRLVAGVHPPCHSCQGETEYLWTERPASIETNERFIGGVTIENMGHEPVTVYSREEFARAMQTHGVEQRIKYVPGDKHLTNWANGIDAYTLEAATALVSNRTHLRARGDESSALPSYQSSVQLVKGGEDVPVRRER